MDYSYDEVLEAYIKLKTYIYYDSTNLFMRKQLAEFETSLTDDDDYLNRLIEYNSFKKKLFNQADFDETGLVLYEVKLRVFTQALNKFHEAPEYFDTFLNRIKAKFLPKKIKDLNSESKIISNKRISDKYIATRSAVFIDAPIEIHLISVLWILRKGIHLDKELFEGCLGNRLILNKERDAVVKGSGLFKPYPRQYQKWRDESVKVAKEHLDKGENVLLLNLDIRDFFYSVRIPRKDIWGTSRSRSNLFSIFGKIHEIFTLKLSKEYHTPYDYSGEIFDSKGNITEYVLPIGLLSSFILANDYLVEFDERVIKKAKPVYYGRYVDDILMVIVNPDEPNNKKEDLISELNFDFVKYRSWLNKSEHHDLEEKLIEEDYNNLSDLEQFVLSNFFPIITLIDKPSFLLSASIDIDKKNEKVFKLNGYKRLYCQSDKTLLYYFDKDESTLVIDKLKRDLEEKSSEFRNYTDDDDDEKFEESAYHLLYDGTEGKVRTLKDYKEDKFGLSVYLSKRIFNALRRADKVSDEEAIKIVKFFRGINTLNLYTLWERVFVFLLVNNKPDEYVKLYLNCIEAIENLQPDKKSVNISIEKYHCDLLEYLDAANELALSLHPKFLSEIKKVKRTYEFSFNALKNGNQFFNQRYSPTNEKSYFIRRFRQSNLVRHQYVAQPLLTYTKGIKNDYKNFTDLKLFF